MTSSSSSRRPAGTPGDRHAGRGHRRRQGAWRVAACLSLIAGCLALAAPAQAVLCSSGFVDVPGDANYCAAAAWMKARAITTGCTDAAHYCPDEAVTRASMALFMKRLGGVLSPSFMHQTQSVNPIVDGSVYCVTPGFAVTGYNRVATGNASFHFGAASASQASGRLVYSVNGGATWNNWAAYAILSDVPSGKFVAASSTAAPLVMGVGETVSFGLKVGAIAATYMDCELTVRIDHTNQEF